MLTANVTLAAEASVFLSNTLFGKKTVDSKQVSPLLSPLHWFSPLETGNLDFCCCSPEKVGNL